MPSGRHTAEEAGDELTALTKEWAFVWKMLSRCPLRLGAGDAGQAFPDPRRSHLNNRAAGSLCVINPKSRITLHQNRE